MIIIVSLVSDKLSFLIEVRWIRQMNFNTLFKDYNNK